MFHSLFRLRAIIRNRIDRARLERIMMIRRWTRLTDEHFETANRLFVVISLTAYITTPGQKIGRTHQRALINLDVDSLLGLKPPQLAVWTGGHTTGFEPFLLVLAWAAVQVRSDWVWVCGLAAHRSDRKRPAVWASHFAPG